MLPVRPDCHTSVVPPQDRARMSILPRVVATSRMSALTPRLGARRSRPARVHHRRPDRPTSARAPHGRGHAPAHPGSCSTPRTRPGFRYFDAARSYGRAEAFLGRGWRLARARTTSPSAPSGATAMSLAGGWTPSARGEGPLAARVHPRSSARPRPARDRLASIKSTRPPSRPACSTTPAVPRARRAERLRRAGRVVAVGPVRPRCCGGPWTSRSAAHRCSPRPGHVEPAGALRGPGARRGGRRGWRVIIKEAVANGRLTPRERRTTSRAGRAAAVAAELGFAVDQLAIAARRWPSRGRGGCSPARSRPSSWTSNLAPQQVAAAGRGARGARRPSPSRRPTTGPPAPAVPGPPPQPVRSRSPAPSGPGCASGGCAGPRW